MVAVGTQQRKMQALEGKIVDVRGNTGDNMLKIQGGQKKNMTIL